MPHENTTLSIALCITTLFAASTLVALSTSMCYITISLLTS